MSAIVLFTASLWFATPVAGQRTRVTLPATSTMALSGTVLAEGEQLAATAQTADGRATRQAMESFGRSWSGGAQLFWTASRPGARLELPVQAPAAGTYYLDAYLTKAPDYAVVQVGANGKQVGQFDGFNAAGVVHSGRVRLGQVALNAGENRIIFVVQGKHPRSTGYFVGIDKLELTPLASSSSTPSLQRPNTPSTARPIVGAPEISIAELARNIQQALEGKVMGFALVVRKPGQTTQSIARGVARAGADAPERALTVDDRLNIASVNKPITAVAVLQLLGKNGLSIDSPMHEYLPTKWQLGPNVKTITFKELLTHRSGIRWDNANQTDYESLQKVIAGGIDPADKKSFSYQNQNFALFRVIIPYLVDRREKEVTLPFGVKVDQGTITSDGYFDYLNSRVFGPLGISTVGAKPVGSQPAKCYPFRPGPTAGTDWGDWTKTCGGGGLHLSAQELSTFLWNLRQGNKLLSDAMKDAMFQNQLGIYMGNAQGATTYSHGGYLRSGDPATTPVPQRTELNSLVMDYSDGTQVALIVNSSFADSPSAPPDFGSVVNQAYAKSWIMK